MYICLYYEHNYTAGVSTNHVDKMKRQIKNMLKANHEAQGIIFVIGILGPAGISVDIENVSSTFKGLNFVVWEARDYTYADIACLLHAATTTTLPGIKFIAFYYAGHGGIDEYGRSFILPMKEKDGEERLFIEENILSSFKNARKHCLFFFDCRLSSSTQSSISTLPHPPAKPIHSLVAYATSPGYVTMGDRGLWTRTLCEKLREPLSLSDILDQTYDVVSHDQTYGVVSDDRRQLPCYESNLGAVYLKGNLIVYTINLLFDVSFIE